MEYYYIPLSEGSKRPVLEWGGWPIDAEHENIFTEEEAKSADWDNWAIVGSETKNLIVIDVDLYKMDSDQKESVENGWGDFLDVTRIVKTQSGGVHVYFIYDDQDEEYLVPPPVQYVDIKGDIGKGYVVAPFSPGYEISNDKEPFPITFEQLKNLPVFENDWEPNPKTDSDIPTSASMFPPCFKRSVKYMGSKHDRSNQAATFVRDYLRKVGWSEDKIKSLFEDNHPNFNGSSIDSYSGSKLNVYDVISNVEFPENERVEHPDFLHDSPSDSKANFMVDTGGETFRCWRHDVTGNALHLIGIKAGLIDCADWKHGKISSETWKEIFDHAESKGYELPQGIVDCDVMDSLDLCPYNCGKSNPLQGVVD